MPGCVKGTVLARAGIQALYPLRLLSKGFKGERWWKVIAKMKWPGT